MAARWALLRSGLAGACLALHRRGRPGREGLDQPESPFLNHAKVGRDCLRHRRRLGPASHSALGEQKPSNGFCAEHFWAECCKQSRGSSCGLTGRP